MTIGVQSEELLIATSCTYRQLSDVRPLWHITAAETMQLRNFQSNHPPLLSSLSRGLSYYFLLLLRHRARQNGAGRARPSSSMHRSLPIASAEDLSRPRYMRVSGTNRRPRTSGYLATAAAPCGGCPAPATSASLWPPRRFLSCAPSRCAYAATASMSASCTTGGRWPLVLRWMDKICAALTIPYFRATCSAKRRTDGLCIV
jgi:hypothetical protein